MTGGADPPEKEEEMYKCKICGKLFPGKENEGYFKSFGEDELWNHLITEHEEAFEKCQGKKTKAMIRKYYKSIKVK